MLGRDSKYLVLCSLVRHDALLVGESFFNAIRLCQLFAPVLSHALMGTRGARRKLEHARYTNLFSRVVEKTRTRAPRCRPLLTTKKIYVPLDPSRDNEITRTRNMRSQSIWSIFKNPLEALPAAGRRYEESYPLFVLQVSPKFRSTHGCSRTTSRTGLFTTFEDKQIHRQVCRWRVHSYLLFTYLSDCRLAVATHVQAWRCLL